MIKEKYMIGGISSAYEQPFTITSDSGFGSSQHSRSSGRSSAGGTQRTEHDSENSNDKQKALELEKSLLQSTLLVLKSKTGEDAASAELLSNIEAKIENISNEIKVTKSKTSTPQYDDLSRAILNPVDKVQISAEGREMAKSMA